MNTQEIDNTKFTNGKKAKPAPHYSDCQHSSNDGELRWSEQANTPCMLPFAATEYTDDAIAAVFQSEPRDWGPIRQVSSPMVGLRHENRIAADWTGDMKIDLHCHSKFSQDNHLAPEVLIRRALEIGLDGVCFTEHHSIRSSWLVDRIFVPQGFHVFRGVEVSTEMGHLLVYGVVDDSWNHWGRNNCLNLIRVMDSVHAKGGICIPAHPFRGWESLGEKIFSITGFDGIETHNGVNAALQNAPAMEAALTLGLPSIGGSDCHYLEQVGKAYTEFDNRIEDLAGMVGEIRVGNCRGRFL